MANPFRIVRWWAYALCLISAIAVLGIMAHQASVFIDNPSDKPYIIFLLVTASLTIAILTLVSLRSQPRIDVVVIAVLCILWLAAGAYSADRVGHIDCETLRGTRRPAKNGDADNQMWCRELKAVMAFSFFDFGLLLVSLVILITLILRLYSRGEAEIWERSMTDLYTYGHHPAMHHIEQGPRTNYGGRVVYQQPGHDVVIENGEVRQVPTGTY